MTQYIHIALMGAVSAGKSTLINGLFVARYSDMSMKRTTANEIIYYETDNDEKNQILTTGVTPLTSGVTPLTTGVTPLTTGVTTSSE